jgi:hypothetical protein
MRKRSHTASNDPPAAADGRIASLTCRSLGSPHEREAGCSTSCPGRDDQHTRPSPTNPRSHTRARSFTGNRLESTAPTERLRSLTRQSGVNAVKRTEEPHIASFTAVPHQPVGNQRTFPSSHRRDVTARNLLHLLQAAERVAKGRSVALEDLVADPNPDAESGAPTLGPSPQKEGESMRD